MKCDYGAAARYIEAVTGSAKTPMCWQVIHRDKGVQVPAARHSKLRYIWQELVAQNFNGFGIYATVNRVADGKRRLADNVMAVRALFIDYDGPPSREPPLPPSFIVRSGRGPHYYWVLDEGEEITAFTSAQRHLIRYYGSDPAIHDLSRVMRVPGFYHNKGAPVMVTIEQETGAIYTIRDVVEAHHVDAVPVSTPVRRPLPQGGTGAWEKVPMVERVRQAAAYLAGVPEAIEGAGGDRRTFQTCAIVMNDFAVDDLDAALVALTDWNARCAPPWDESDLERKLRNSARYAREPKGSRLSVVAPRPPAPDDPPGWLSR